MNSMDQYQDQIDEIYAEAMADRAYYNGKCEAYQTASSKLSLAKDRTELYEELNRIRKEYIQDKEDETYSDFIDKENRSFLNGRVDGIDEVRDIVKFESIKIRKEKK